MKTRHLEQEKLLKKLTNFIQMYWDETLDLEMSDIIDQCSKSDTDFEFVIDQSGSGMVFVLPLTTLALGVKIWQVKGAIIHGPGKII